MKEITRFNSRCTNCISHNFIQYFLNGELIRKQELSVNETNFIHEIINEYFKNRNFNFRKYYKNYLYYYFIESFLIDDERTWRRQIFFIAPFIGRNNNFVKCALIILFNNLHILNLTKQQNFKYTEMNLNMLQDYEYLIDTNLTNYVFGMLYSFISCCKYP